MATHPRTDSSGDPATGAAAHAAQRSPMLWQILSALSLLAMGGIHLYLVSRGAGGLIGVLFVLNAIGGLVLAIAMVAAPRRILPAASVLSLLFLAGTLLALVLALTVGLFGIHQQIGAELVVTTLVVESIGTVVLLVTTALVLRMRRVG
jgi:small-conductance mechanosensitive channel